MSGIQDLNQRVGSRLRELRRIHELSQAEFASRLGVSSLQIQKFEVGIVSVPAVMLPKICDILDEPIEALLSCIEEGPGGSDKTKIQDGVINLAKELKKRDSF